MNKLLTKYNLYLRSQKRIIDKDCVLRKRGSLLHVCLNSTGCRYGLKGSCTMCNYGQGHSISKLDVEKIICDIMNEIDDTTESILIGTLGSVFDSEEISRDVLECICKWLNSTRIKTIIFETHYLTINKELCEWLCRLLPKKDIVVELGLESTSSFVQKNCLNKFIDLDKFRNTVDLLHMFSFSVTANVFLGAPFLSVHEQVKDTQNTILWTFKNNIDSVTIFPANIRKNTFIEYLYLNNKYKRVSHWQVIEVLNSIPLEFLNRVFISWYGDWMDFDENGSFENLPPTSCDICKNKWSEFYEHFLCECNSNKRKNIINNFYKYSKCDCSLLDETTYDENKEEVIRQTSNWLKMSLDE